MYDFQTAIRLKIFLKQIASLQQASELTSLVQGI
jgi:hypothetical protein